MPDPQERYESTPNLYRPGQIEEAQSDIEALSGMLSPDNVRDYKIGTRVRARAQRQLSTIRTNLERYTPQPYQGADLDKAVAEANMLRDRMVAGDMPTDREMRRCTPGTVDRHRAWEAKYKSDWLRWKYLEQRIHAGSDARDTANFEKHRPKGGTAEGDLSVSLVPSKDFHFGPAFGQDVPTVMTDDELGVLKALDPALAGQVALLDAEGREQVRDVVRGLLSDGAAVCDGQIDTLPKAPPSPAPAAKPKRKSNWTPERKKAFGEKMKAARAAKAAERAKSKEPA